MCLYPKLVKNPKYKPNKKNGGIVPELKDIRVLAVPIGCGKCMECMNKKKREWRVRLAEEIRDNSLKKYFVTMTYSTESYNKLLKETGVKGYEGDNRVATLGMRRFLERWRKKYKKSVRHWGITELGGGRYEHLHIHAIIMTNIQPEEIETIWQYGKVWIGDYVNEKTINYITKYLHKEDKLHKAYKPIILSSKGIGSGYMKRNDKNNNKYNEKGNTDERYTNRSGVKMAMPIYYRNKIYTEDEKEKLWIEKLDKNERWVGGERVSIKDNEIEYKKLVKEYRSKSIELGYGKPLKYKEKEYENNRRVWLQNKRAEEKGKEIKEEMKEEIKGYIPKKDEW